MRIEVDQSGKIERTQTNTVLAFSNKIDCAILILAVEKRECLEVWRRRGKSGKSLYQKLFVAALFLLLKDHLPQTDSIVIDPEYPGREHEIRVSLLRYIRRVVPDFSADRIVFHSIGKQSRAHKKASVFSEGMNQRIEKFARASCLR